MEGRGAEALRKQNPDRQKKGKAAAEKPVKTDENSQDTKHHQLHLSQSDNNSRTRQHLIAINKPFFVIKGNQGKPILKEGQQWTQGPADAQQSH